MSELAWTDDRRELAAVTRMLVDLEWIESAAAVVDFLDAPWKWATQRDAWVTAGRPDLGQPNWELFAARVARDD